MASEPIAPTPARAPFHLLTKPAGSACNLACQYCFYLEKARLYPGTTRFRMTPDMLERYVRERPEQVREVFHAESGASLVRVFEVVSRE